MPRAGKTTACHALGDQVMWWMGCDEGLCNTMPINILNARPFDLLEQTLSHMPEYIEEGLCNTMPINILNARPFDLLEQTLSHMPEYIEGHDVRVFSMNQRHNLTDFRLNVSGHEVRVFSVNQRHTPTDFRLNVSGHDVRVRTKDSVNQRHNLTDFRLNVSVCQWRNLRTIS
eukprot:GHVN01078938.1.p1 GENE.GHVN01078938.1~~GHVN01078938.1.p1  ORF type:complete len:172 (-),score=14.82 GHVN01078938.1:176-691(-)